MRRNKNLNKYRNLIDGTSKIANRDKKDHIQLFEDIRNVNCRTLKLNYPAQSIMVEKIRSPSS